MGAPISELPSANSHQRLRQVIKVAGRVGPNLYAGRRIRIEAFFLLFLLSLPLPPDRMLTYLTVAPFRFLQGWYLQVLILGQRKLPPRCTERQVPSEGKRYQRPSSWISCSNVYVTACHCMTTRD